IGRATVPRAQLLLPYPHFGGIGLTGDSNATSRYDSLILRAQKRFNQGLTFALTYAWSKNCTDSYLDSTGVNSGGHYQTAYELGREYGLAFIHTPHRVTTTVTYEL